MNKRTRTAKKNAAALWALFVQAHPTWTPKQIHDAIVADLKIPEVKTYKKRGKKSR